MKVFWYIWILFLPLNGSAQGYVSFPDSNVIWVNTLMYLDWDIWGMPNYEIAATDNYCANGEDTLIGAFTYTKLHLCNSDYQGAFRDNGGQVYFVAADSTQEYLIYDFTLEENDTAWNVFQNNMGFEPLLLEYVVAYNIDSMLIQGDYRKVIYLGGSGYWIEGIGCSQGLLNEYWANISDYLFDLHCMSQNDLLLWPNDGTGSCPMDVGVKSDEIQMQVYPNPTSGKFRMNWSNDLVQKITVINSMGQIIQPEIALDSHSAEVDLTPFPSGVYIIQLGSSDGIQLVKILKH